jgi:hypothetical protein
MRKLYDWILGKFGYARVFHCGGCGNDFETLARAIKHVQIMHPDKEFTVDI